jgi:hypothetical protein
MSTKALSDKDMNGLKVINLGDGSSAGDAINKGQLDTGVTTAESRANHTGSQLAATISDFNTAVRLNRPEQLATPTGALSMGSQRITTMADPTSAQDAATRAYVDAAVAALSGGLAFKGAVRAATASNVNVASAPSTIDGVTPTAGDVFLLTGQTTGAQNGPYTWASAGAAMTRPVNWDTTTEAVPGSLWVVQQGTFDNQLAILSNDSFTLATTTGTFVFLNPAAASDNDSSYTETSPTTSAGAAWAVNHNLGSKNVQVTVFRTASPFDIIRDVLVTLDTTNQVNVRPDVALASGEFTITVSKVV